MYIRPEVEYLQDSQLDRTRTARWHMKRKRPDPSEANWKLKASIEKYTTGKTEPTATAPREGSDFRYPYRGADVRRTLVDVAAKVTSKGQVTVPKVVRDALGIRDGDEVIFRVEGNRAVLARTPNFLDLAATVSVPAAKRNVAWDEVIRRTRSARSAARR
jgi:AbrB family looped-hinge helix DNA binding protein